MPWRSTRLNGGQHLEGASAGQDADQLADVAGWWPGQGVPVALFGVVVLSQADPGAGHVQQLAAAGRTGNRQEDSKPHRNAPRRACFGAVLFDARCVNHAPSGATGWLQRAPVMAEEREPPLWFVPDRHRLAMICRAVIGCPAAFSSMHRASTAAPGFIPCCVVSSWKRRRSQRERWTTCTARSTGTCNTSPP